VRSRRERGTVSGDTASRKPAGGRYSFAELGTASSVGHRRSPRDPARDGSARGTRSAYDESAAHPKKSRDRRIPPRWSILSAQRAAVRRTSTPHGIVKATSTPMTIVTVWRPKKIDVRPAEPPYARLEPTVPWQRSHSSMSRMRPRPCKPMLGCILVLRKNSIGPNRRDGAGGQ
jgi:hypothetical protein